MWRSFLQRMRLSVKPFDVPENKAMLVNGIMEHFPEKYLVCGSGMAGFGDSNAIHTRKVMKRIYLCGDETTEAVEGRGLMAPRVALCAAHEANMILELILNIMQAGRKLNMDRKMGTNRRYFGEDCGKHYAEFRNKVENRMYGNSEIIPLLPDLFWVRANILWN